MTYRFPIRVGDRVAIAPHHDLWMAGCRFGTVRPGNTGTTDPRVHVIRLDTGRDLIMHEDDLLGAVGDWHDPIDGPDPSLGATPSTKPDLTGVISVLDAVRRGLTLVMAEVDPVTTEQAAVMHGATPSTASSEGPLNWAGFHCPEFDEDGSCIHSDHMAQAEGAAAADAEPTDEMTFCIHDQCGYGDCSWLQESPNLGLCNTHGNGKGQCQRQPDHCVCC